ncbi:hypothetical protein [Microcoleus sp. FACHB-68]|uniref:hypothetical protein n=1 Tax=Microcoleus sp. FACHB-68 TaxID=2692826 RepID=UPI001689A579|nr:hypothetical protein [Microcoleus sp. FACHB-68]MBD1940079.1 hypothetical protein [Microcoleus sp. FACHB-68]
MNRPDSSSTPAQLNKGAAAGKLCAGCNSSKQVVSIYPLSNSAANKFLSMYPVQNYVLALEY